MATTVRVTPQDYLRMTKASDRPDAEYVRGEIIERGRPDLALSGLKSDWL